MKIVFIKSQKEAPMELNKDNLGCLTTKAEVNSVLITWVKLDPRLELSTRTYTKSLNLKGNLGVAVDGATSKVNKV